ncbi:MAG TPA: hypothetical protein VG963_26675 [Polyangiaceae bacterium]|nr:hypothetical protein [Polyangiaceae bacterium]
MNQDERGTKPSGVEGEGSYTATHRYNERLKKQLESEDVEQLAEEARKALEGDEREELEEAEQLAKQGRSLKQGARQDAAATPGGSGQPRR